MKQSIIYKLFIKDIGLAGISHIILALKGLILLPILAKALGPTYYGIWTQIMITTSLLLPIILLKLDTAMIRFLGDEDNIEKTGKGISSIFLAVFLSLSFVSILLLMLPNKFTVFLFGDLDAAYFIKVLVILVFITALDQMLFQYFLAFHQMARYAFFTLLQSIAEVSLVGFFVIQEIGLFWPLASLILVRILIFAVCSIYIIPNIKLSKPSISLLTQYLAFSLPLILFTLACWILNTGDRYIIGYFLGARDVGIYNAAYTIGGLVGLFEKPVATILLPTLANLFRKNLIDEIKICIQYSIKLFLFFAFPSLVGLSLLSKDLLNILSTNEFAKGSNLIPVICLATIFSSIGDIFTDILILGKGTQSVSFIYGSSALLNILLNLILVPMFGIFGAAIATFIAFLLQCSIMGYLGFGVISIDLDFNFMIKCIISSLLMGTSIFLLLFTTQTNVIFYVLIGIIIYLAIAVLLKTFTREEYEFLASLISRKCPN